MTLLVLIFLLYSAFCYWAIILDGVESLRTWETFALFGGFAASLSNQELKFYFGISWFFGVLVIGLKFFGAF